VPVIYSARGISKRFGVVQALCDVDLDVAQGSVVGLVGANGAGKVFHNVSLCELRMDTGTSSPVGEATD
jgi:ABC-type branched-subunit amino acid transport system ATPase component